MYGHQPQELLQLVSAQWVMDPMVLPSPPGQYLINLRDNLEVAQAEVWENLERAQWIFQVGDKVLDSQKVLRDSHGDPWRGPYPIIRIFSPITYDVCCGCRCKLKHLHVNDLKI